MNYRSLAIYAGLAIGLAYVSHVGVMRAMAWKLCRKYSGPGHAEAVREYLPAYAYPRRRTGPVRVKPGARDSPGVVVWR